MEKRKVHIELIRLVGDSNDHEHIHFCDEIIDSEMSIEDIAKQFSLEVYDCDEDGCGNGRHKCILYKDLLKIGKS